jgi:dTDP-4-amino-4,6-dideoxygalactose transaminase
LIPLARPILGPGEQAAAARVLASGMVRQGPEVEAFEAEFSAHVDGRSCVAVSSGTAALHLLLLAADIGPGDEVVVPSFTFAATANAVRLAGATPVFADIEPGSFCLDPDAAAAALTPKTAAIMPVHLYGHPAAMDRLRALAGRHGLLLAEDAAQAHGSRLHGTPAGALGDGAAFSFYATKNMTTGEGGMIVTADPAVARAARLLRDQGMSRRYHHEVVGFNARLTDVAAAIGRVQLRRLAGWNTARRANAARYDAELRGVEVPPVAEGATHVYHAYTVRSRSRDRLQAALERGGIGCDVIYPLPVHRQPAYAVAAVLPETEAAVAEVLSIPVRPDLTAAEVGAVVAAVNAAGTG